MGTVVNAMNDVKMEDKQEASKINMREQFLKHVQHLHGKECKIALYENSSVSGVFSGCDLSLESIAISSLMTPIGPVRHALLRKCDIVAMKFTDVDLSQVESGPSS